MEGSSHSLLKGTVLMRTPFFWDMTMYQLLAGPNVLKQSSGFKTMGSNYPITQHRTTEEQNPQLHHCKNLITILIYLDTQKEPKETLSQDSQFPTRNLNLDISNTKESATHTRMTFSSSSSSSTLLFSINPITDSYHKDVEMVTYQSIP